MVVVDGPDPRDKTNPLSPEAVRRVEKRIEEALSLAASYGQIDGGHHRLWVIDQMVRALLELLEGGADAARVAVGVYARTERVNRLRAERDEERREIEWDKEQIRKMADAYDENIEDWEALKTRHRKLREAVVAHLNDCDNPDALAAAVEDGDAD